MLSASPRTGNCCSAWCWSCWSWRCPRASWARSSALPPASRERADMALLATQALTKSFGDNFAVNRVDFTVMEGEVLALIGSNGAGKTTLVNLVSGLLRPDSGQILFQGHDVTQQTSYERIKSGIARSFQLV